MGLRNRTALAAAMVGLVLAGCGGHAGSSGGAGTKAPTVTSPSRAKFVAGTAGTFTITAEGKPTPAISHSAVTAQQPGVPAAGTWLHFEAHHNGTATFSGTPPESAGGTYGTTVIATSSAGIGSQALTITVDAAPVIASPSSLTVRIGSGIRFTFSAQGYPAVRPQVTGVLPKGLTLAAGRGIRSTTMSGTPSVIPNSGGVYPLTVSAANGVGTPGVQQFVLTIAIVPEFTSAKSTMFGSGVPSAFTVTTTSYPTAHLSVVSALPPGLHFTDHGNGTGTLSGTLTAGPVTHFLVMLRAQNDFNLQKQSALRVVVVRFTGANHTVFRAGVPKSFAFTISKKGFPFPHPVVTGRLPAGLTLTEVPNTTTTVLSGTAAVGAVGVYPLTVSVDLGTGPPLTEPFLLGVVK
jgi:Putative Ig domain